MSKKSRQVKQRAVIYARQAVTELMDLNKTAAEQEIACRKYAEEHGYRVLGIFRDIADADIEPDRIGFELMLDYISEGEVDVVISHSADRLPENLRKYGYGTKPFERFGVRLIEVDRCVE